jgi:DNA-binding MarR family transcriptional regulator
MSRRPESDLLRLMQAVRSIQIGRAETPWKSLELTMAQLKAVMFLVRAGRARSRDLADGLGIAPSAATPLVDRLVEEKLARRADDSADRRVVWIHPTPRAQTVYDALMDMSELVLADVIAEVPAAERKRMLETLRLLAEAADRVLEKDRQSR